MTRRKSLFRRRVLWAWLLLLAFLPQWVMKTLHRHDACAASLSCTLPAEAAQSATKSDLLRTQTRLACAPFAQTERAAEAASAQRSAATLAARRHCCTEASAADEVSAAKAAAPHFAAAVHLAQGDCALCDYLFFPSTEAVFLSFDFSCDFLTLAPIAQAFVYSHESDRLQPLRGPPVA